MANVEDEQAQDPNSQGPTNSQSNEAVPEREQGRSFTIDHSVQPCIQFPDQLQHELENATAEQTQKQLSEPLPEVYQEVEVTEPYIDPHVTLTEEELSGIVTSEQVPSRTLPDVRVISGFTPDVERELLSILADIRGQYSAARRRRHRFRGIPQVEIGVIQGPAVRAEEIFVTPPGSPPSGSENSPQPDHGVAASEKEKKLKSPEPSKATGSKRKYTRLASAATGAGVSEVPVETQTWVDVPVQELAYLPTLVETTTTTLADTPTVNLAEQVNDVEDHEKRVSREAVEKWLEDCRPKE